MDRAILEAQLLALNAQLATLPPASPQAVMVESQIQTITNELAFEPVAPPIWGPHPWHGPEWRR
jgi:hypothetical protein